MKPRNLHTSDAKDRRYASKTAHGFRSEQLTQSDQPSSTPDRFQAYSRYSGSYGSGGSGTPTKSAAGKYSRNNAVYSAATARKSTRNKKVLIGALCTLLVAVVGCGAVFVLWAHSVGKELNQGNKSDEELSAISDALSSAKNSEPFYMLLIGSDSRDDNSTEGTRSDTNIVARIDSTTNTITLISIPRDTMIEMDGYGTQKFNAAYSFEGVPGVIREASQLLGVEISHYAEVSFGDLEELVDAVGGVDVVVNERIEDPKAGNVVIEEGEQHLDGEAALVFARSRAFADGDFSRTSNQRALVAALSDKVMSLSAAEMPGVVKAAASCVTTDFTLADILDLVSLFSDEGKLTTYSAMVPSTTEYIDGISYVINDEAATKEMMDVVDAGGNPEEVVDTSSSGGSSGMSAEEKNRKQYYEQEQYIASN